MWVALCVTAAAFRESINQLALQDVVHDLRPGGKALVASVTVTGQLNGKTFTIERRKVRDCQHIAPKGTRSCICCHMGCILATVSVHYHRVRLSSHTQSVHDIDQ